MDKYGTHVIVGLKMGGKDMVCVKQLKGSNLTQSELQARLKNLAYDTFSRDRPESFAARNGRFSQGLLNGNLGPSSAAWNTFRSPVIYQKDDVVGMHIRRGGVDDGQCHDEWLPTITGSPDVISMAFVPITSLLTSVPGCGFLNHAVNLYLRYKPPVEELRQFLEFQVPRQWAPEFGELPLALGPQRKKNSLPSLQFALMGPKLRVNPAKVDSGNRPVTAIRLFLEGKKNNRLGVHLQHLSATPSAITVVGEAVSAGDVTVKERAYFEPVRSPLLTHACTVPVQYNGARIDDCAAVVTRSWLEVREACLKKVLFLRLGFSGVASTKVPTVGVGRAARRVPEVGLPVGAVQRAAVCRGGGADAAARGEGGGELRGVPERAACATARAEDGEVRGHHGGDEGPRRLAGVLGGHRRETLRGRWQGRTQGQVLVAHRGARGRRRVRPASSFASVCSSLRFVCCVV